MSDKEISDLFDTVRNHARIVAKGRLHRDDCDSEAGMAVVKAMHSHDSKKSSLRTWACRLVAWRIRKAIRKAAKYVNQSTEWWASLIVKTPTDAGDILLLRELHGLVANGATIREVRRAVGTSYRQARHIHSALQEAARCEVEKLHR